jgi:hypothetical protein
MVQPYSILIIFPTLPKIMPSISTAALPLHHQVPALTTKQTKITKQHVRVRFAPPSSLEQVQCTISRFDMADHEVHACWWSSEEQNAYTQRARMILQRSKQQKQAFISKTLDRSYQKACHVVSQSLALAHQPLSDLSVTQICSNDELVRSKSLHLWSTYCAGRRGLEGYLTTDERLTQSALHRQFLLSEIAGVTVTTMSISEDGHDSNFSGMVSEAALNDDLIAQLSIQSSAASRVFARMMGEADAQYVIEHC